MGIFFEITPVRACDVTGEMRPGHCMILQDGLGWAAAPLRVRALAMPSPRASLSGVERAHAAGLHGTGMSTTRCLAMWLS